MKALSLRQPWANLVVSGRKTLELRTWQVAYRGPLAIHASKSVDPNACAALGLNSAQLPAGAVVGMVDLVDVVLLDEVTYLQRQAEHLAAELFPFPADKPLYGWVLTNPRQWATPRPATGRMGLFTFQMPADQAGPPAMNDPDALDDIPEGAHEIAELDSRRPFELRLAPETNGNAVGGLNYRLGIIQRTARKPDQLGFEGLVEPPYQQVVELGGQALLAVVDAVLEAIRQNGYSATDLRPGRHAPFRLEETSGVRLALLFLAVRPVSKVQRVEALSRAIRAMPTEELYYWFSKCAMPDRAQAERAQKALRILLAEE